MTSQATDRDVVMRFAKMFLTSRARRWIRARRRVKAFRLTLRPTDVFLIGHPKSGNTWLAYLLGLALFENRRKDITLKNVGDYIPFIHGQDLRVAEYSHLPDPRIFRNECPVFPELYPKVIYLMRDPRAVLVSFYHMYRVMLNDTTMLLKTFVENYLATDGCFKQWNVGLARWDRQVLEWMERAKSDPRICVVKYEDLVRDRKVVLTSLLNFIGATYSEENLDHAAARGDFQLMQQMEREYGVEAYPGEIGQRGRFIRRGLIDGWQDELHIELSQDIERTFAPAMRMAGYL
jgi:hypothetical protein